MHTGRMLRSAVDGPRVYENMVPFSDSAVSRLRGFRSPPRSIGWRLVLQGLGGVSPPVPGVLGGKDGGGIGGRGFVLGE